MNDSQATQAGWWFGLAVFLLGVGQLVEWWLLDLPAAIRRLRHGPPPSPPSPVTREDVAAIVNDTIANQLAPSNEKMTRDAVELERLIQRVKYLEEDRTRLEEALREERRKVEEERKKGEEERKKGEEALREERKKGEEAVREERRRGDISDKTYRFENRLRHGPHPSPPSPVTREDVAAIVKDTIANQLAPSIEKMIRDAVELERLIQRVKYLEEDRTRLEGALREERKKGGEERKKGEEERRRGEEALREERRRGAINEKTYRFEKYASGGSGRSVPGA